MVKELVSFKCCLCGKQNNRCEDNHTCECKKVKLRYCKFHKKHYQYVCGTHHDCPECEWLLLLEKNKLITGTTDVKTDKKCPLCAAGGRAKVLVGVNGEMVCLDCLRASNVNTMNRIKCDTCQMFLSDITMNWRQPSNKKGIWQCNECLTKGYTH